MKKAAIHKAIILTCLCSMSFYLGLHVIGETEASFSSQVSTKPITISAAIIFPETIKLLEDRADEIADQMHHEYERINTVQAEGSLQVLHDRFTKVESIEKELYQQFTALQQIYNELSDYHNQTNDNGHTFDYVSEGLLNVENRLKEVREKIDFQKLEMILSSISVEIKEREDKASQGNTQVKQHNGSTEIQIEPEHEATKKLNNNEQAPEHTEKTQESKEEKSQETAQFQKRQENSKSLIEGSSNQETSQSSNNNEQVVEHAENNFEMPK